MEIRLDPPPWATHLVSDLTDWKTAPVPVAEMAPFTLPDDAYFEYAYLDAHGEPQPDPANELARNPWWTYARGIEGPGYAPTLSNLPSSRKSAGHLERYGFASKILGERRRFLIYSPPGHAADELPVLVVHDGLAFLHFAQMPAVIDTLVGEGLIPPVRLALVPPTDREAEYAFNEKYLEFTLSELVLEIDRVANGTGERMVMGASLGGLVSARLAWMAPEVFSTVIALSGAFITGPESPRDHRTGPEWFRREIRKSPLKQIRFSMFCGTLEWLVDANRDLAAALHQQGYVSNYVERPSGHNWVSWRDAMADALQFALHRKRAGI